MCPGGDKAKSSSLDFTKPPFFSTDSDVQEWRKRVADWVATMKDAFDKGEDRNLKPQYWLMGRILFNQLPTFQQNMVDEAVKKRLINLGTSDDPNDPIQTVISIVNLVAFDHPVAMVTRITASFQRVMSCRQGKKETLKKFVSRFYGLSAKYMGHLGASPSSQTGQMLAITLLNNADLDETTSTNAMCRLLEMATTRVATPPQINIKSMKNNQDSTMVSTKGLQEIRKASESICRVLPSESDLRLRFKIPMSFIKTVNSASKVIETNLAYFEQDEVNVETDDEDEDSSIEEMFKEKHSSFLIHFDDAVSVLRNLTQAQSTTKNMFTLDEVNQMFDRKMKSFFAGQGRAHPSTYPSKDNNNNRFNPRHDQDKLGRNSDGRKVVRFQDNGAGSSSHHHSDSPNDNKKRPREENSPPAGLRCFDCGKTDHLCGSPLCKFPAWQTKQLWKKTKTDNGDQFFPGGSRK